MKSAIAIKAFAGVGAVGAIATGVTFSFLPDSFGSYLNKEGRTLLTSGSEHWDTLIKKYNEENDLLLRIDNAQIAKDKLDKAKLEKWCSENSSKTFTNTDDPIYFKLSAWCTEPTTIQKQIGGGRTVLDITEPDTRASKTNKNEAIWTTKVSEYKTELTNGNYLIKEINSDGAAEGTEIKAASGVDAKKLRAWCKFSQDKHFKHEKDKRFLTYLKWCVN